MKIIKWLAKRSGKIAIAYGVVAMIPIGIAYQTHPDSPPPPWAWGLAGIMAALGVVCVVSAYLTRKIELI